MNTSFRKTISVYGSLYNDDEDNSKEKVPQDFLIVYNKIIKYRSKDAKKWLPEKIEIMFWDYNYAPNKRSWIKGFPDLNSSTTLKRGDDLYSVFIERDKFAQFKKYFASIGEKEAIEINNRKMAMSYRLPFPNW
ncbi:MAG: hypothetical protein K2Q22_14800 [Cytophagales bacterium]|nr:hypothetical protein [Cytophagales bacterium]